MYVRNSGLAFGYTEVKGKSFGTEIQRKVNADTDIVVLFGGTYDTQSLDSLPQAVADTLSDIRVVAPRAEVIVVGPAWARGGPAPDSFLAVDGILRDAAVLDNSEFVDPIAEGWFDGRDDVLADDEVHLSDAGHRIIEERLADRVVDAAAAFRASNQGPS
jgi:hypothetical protein